MTAADALAVTLADVGHADMDRIAELLGRSREATPWPSWARAVFLDPGTADPEGITGLADRRRLPVRRRARQAGERRGRCD